MPLAEIMNHIERYRFSSELNLAAGTKAFRRGLRGHSLFRQLAEEARDPLVQEEVAKRIDKLSTEPVDARYENRYDAALSAYLLVLAETAEPRVIAKTASAAAKAPNTWWTGSIARELIARAVATGSVKSPVTSHVLPERLVASSDWHRAIGSSLRLWLGELPVTSKTAMGHQLLETLRIAEVNAQAQISANKVIVMPQPPNDGERVVWQARGRNRIPSRMRPAHGITPRQGRARQLAGA